ncbi:MAG: NnrS family protein, partial [Aestuariivirga sp.]
MIMPIHRLFGEGYRVFFLAAGLYALFVLGFWMLWLGVHWAGGAFTHLPFAMAPHLWHGHELVFGYGSAALAGFLLTAVPNWTGAKSARHAFIVVAVAIWLAGRIAMWLSASIAPPIVMAIDLAFLPLLAAKIATQLAKRPKPQNVMFLGLLTIVWSANLMVHLEWAGFTEDTASTGLRAGLYSLCAMIAVLGGRITPAFTRN